MGGTSTAGKGSPVTRPSRTAAAVVDVACDDGKLSLLGVETLILHGGSWGRGLRTMRLMTIGRGMRSRRHRRRTEPTAVDAARPRAAPMPAIATQPRACSPKCDIPRATVIGSRAAADGGLHLFEDAHFGRHLGLAFTPGNERHVPTFPCWSGAGTASRYRSLSSGNSARSSLAQRQRFLEQCRGLRAVALAVDDAAAVRGGDGDAVDLGQQEPARVEGRHVELRTLVVLLRAPA